MRRGFTLLELLVVIVIIAMLTALLTVAVSSASNSAKTAQVRSEISQLESAIAAFRVKFGQDPPSFVQIHSTAAGWSGDAESRGKIRVMWPQFNFSSPTYPFASGTSKTLTGAECLVFFLGGVVQDGAPTGFSTNPASPFSASGSTRQGPFFEFRADRLTDVDGDGAAEYRDPISNQDTPYLYASSNGGTGYDARHLYVRTNNLASPGSGDMQDIYRVFRAGSGSTAQPHNRQSFQIIAAGRDGLYGRGGMWKEGTSFATVVQSDTDISAANKSAASSLRSQEADNLVNFASSTLGK